MAEPINAGDDTPQPRHPPALPAHLLDLWRVVVAGTVLWFAAFVILLVAGWHGVWLWTTLVGGGLGLIGFPIMLWQRSASRSGSRGAQREL